MIPFRHTLTAFLLVSISCHAGLILTQTINESGARKAVSANTIRIDKGNVRIDPGYGTGTYIVYRGDKKTFYLIDLKRRTYTAMNESHFTGSFAKRDQPSGKVRNQLRHFPSENKSGAEDLASPAEGQNHEANLSVYRSVGDGGKVGSWQTNKFEQIRGGTKVADVWTSSPEALGIQEADVQVFKDLSRFFAEFASASPGIFESRQEGLNGFPIRTISYQGNVAVWTSELTAIKKEALSPSIFDLPAGLIQKPLPKKNEPRQVRVP